MLGLCGKCGQQLFVDRDAGAGDFDPTGRLGKQADDARGAGELNAVRHGRFVAKGDGARAAAGPTGIWA